MKKSLTIAAVVLAFGAMAAIAGTINIPQFNDGGGDVNASFFPVGGGDNATFISITNGAAAAKVITVNYYSLAGATAGTSTFNMPAKAVISWRPYETDPAEASNVAASTAAVGWAQILFPGSAGDISGRVFVTTRTAQTAFGFALIPYD